MNPLIHAAMLLVLLVQLHAADVTNLRCEYRENPLGIDVENPRLSWIIEERSQRPEVRGQKPAMSFVAQRAKKNDQRSDVSFDPFSIARLRGIKRVPTLVGPDLRTL
jgi:hypothetical protein